MNFSGTEQITGKNCIYQFLSCPFNEIQIAFVVYDRAKGVFVDCCQSATLIVKLRICTKSSKYLDQCFSTFFFHWRHPFMVTDKSGGTPCNNLPLQLTARAEIGVELLLKAPKNASSLRREPLNLIHFKIHNFISCKDSAFKKCL